MARRLAKWCSYRRDEAGALRRAVRAAAASRCGGPSGGWVYPGRKARCKAAPACGQWPQRGRQLRGMVEYRGVDNLLLLWYTDNAPTREAAVAACQKGRPFGPPLFCCSLALWWASRRCALCLARPASLRGALPPRGAGGGWGMASRCCALRLMTACLPCHEWALAWRGKRPLDKTGGGW